MAITTQCDICKRTREELNYGVLHSFTESHIWCAVRRTNNFDICDECLQLIQKQIKATAKPAHTEESEADGNV